jgi:hypothetical protein
MGKDGGAGSDDVDLDRVKKNYRRLSLRHHPDRKTGDAEAFRMLNRAKVVLSDPRLRREYDLVGLDLEDEADDDGVDGHRHRDDAENDDGDRGGGVGKGGGNDDGGGKDGGGGGGKANGGGGGGGGKTETVMGHLASATLAAILQVVVRTGLMATVSVLISRYTILVGFFVRQLFILLRRDGGYNMCVVLREIISFHMRHIVWFWQGTRERMQLLF